MPTSAPAARPTHSRIATRPYSYNFDGVTFYTGSSPSSGLGAFVAAAGTNAFVIGAPNYTGGGRLYYITATSNFNASREESDQPRHPHGLPGVDHRHLRGRDRNFRRSTGLGSSFADVPNLLGDGSMTDLVIGEPMATVANAETATGTPATATNTGGVFVFPVTSLRPHRWCQQHGASTRTAPFKIAGVNSGDMAGFSVADAGDVNGAMVHRGGDQRPAHRSSGLQLSKAGAAYLVYGGTTLTTPRCSNTRSR